MTDAQSDTVGLLIVLALLLLLLNVKVRSAISSLFTHHTVNTNFNPLSGVSLSLPGGQSASVQTPAVVAAG